MDAEKVQFLHSLILFLHFTLCTSIDTLNINQTVKDGEFLISEANNFALGFFSPGNSSYRYLGIWYYKLSAKTVVWVANRNYPINDSSGVLSINPDGILILYSIHGEKVPVWSANVSMEVAETCVAQLLDSGNLVLLQERSKRIVWQSFDYPTDTLLPGMKLGLNRINGLNSSLTSWRSADDPGSGDYLVKLNPSGSPQMFLYKGANRCWRSVPWPWRAYADVYNYSFFNSQDEVCFSYLVDDAVVQRLVVDISGSFKRLIWHESIGRWKEFWSTPKYRCDSYGRCGANSKCDSHGQFGLYSFECACLPGYEPKSPRDWYLRDGSDGCIRKRQQSSSICRHGEGFIKVPNVKIPDASTAVWMDIRMSHNDCERKCLKDCSCSAYSSIEIEGKQTGCLAWFGELMDTVDDHLAGGNDLYVRVDAIELAENARKSNSSLPILIASVVSAWLVIITFASLFCYKRKQKVKNRRNRRSVLRNDVDTFTKQDSRTHPDLVFFDLTTILAATNNFSPDNKLGHGGFGSVYKGKLSTGREVAVKRQSKNSQQGIEEFKNEIMLIAKLQHRNLVRLEGCCIEEEEQMLVYEYMPNRSLDSFLFDEGKKSLLDWRKRFDIIVGIARGLLYLHHDSRLRIIHRDLKSSNILLDAEMNPKISDFGMARSFKSDQNQEKTKRVVGTYGYMSPEYAVFGKYSVKSDVFSFGVILLEIISGTKVNNFCKEDSSLNLIGYAWELWKENRGLEMLDSSLKESYSYESEEALRFIHIGLLCVQEDPMERPTMSTVILMLNSEIELPPPKKPAFFITEHHMTGRQTGPSSINEVTVTEIVPR